MKSVLVLAAEFPFRFHSSLISAGRRGLFLAAIGLVLLFFPAPAAAADRGIAFSASEPAPPGGWGNYHALVIGINRYHYWPRLRTAVKDATGVRQVLVERYGFSPDRVLLRVDEDASRRQIIADIRTLASSMGPGDNLLVYYAGHGQIDELTGDGYWIPVEGEAKNTATWVSNSFLKAVFGSDKVQAKNIVVIADSCYSGTMLRGGPSLVTLDGDYLTKLAKAAAKRSRQVISSGGVEPVADGGADGHSLFAYYFIKALRENDRKVIDLENLFHTRVWKPVVEIGDQRPNVGRLKTPMDDDGQFVLCQAAPADEDLRRQAAGDDERQAGAPDSLSAVQAERLRLEIERQKLEMEKQLLAQKRQLEMEKLQLEKQKQELALEKMAAQMEAMKKGAPVAARPAPPPARQAAPAAPAPSVASVTPEPAAKKSDIAGRLAVSLFPVRKEYSGAIWSSASAVEQMMVQGICDAVRESPTLRLRYVFEKEPPTGPEEVEIVDPSAYGQDLADLWSRESFFDASKTPRKSIVVDVGRKINSDLSILLNVMFDTRNLRAYVFVVDTRSGAMVKRNFSGSTYSTMRESAHLATLAALEEIR